MSLRIVFFFVRARAEKGIARHLDVSSVVRLLLLVNQIARLARIVVKFNTPLFRDFYNHLSNYTKTIIRLRLVNIGEYSLRHRRIIVNYSDNITTVNYINSMGGTHSMECNAVAKDLWLFCITRQIWIFAGYNPGKQNVQADKESRVFQDNKEWTLRPDIFQLITKIWGEPSIDLSASRVNAQGKCAGPCYASWRPDPDTTYVDAFSISWKKQFFLCFSPI